VMNREQAAVALAIVSTKDQTPLSAVPTAW
jgi:hypothetical protein